VAVTGRDRRLEGDSLHAIRRQRQRVWAKEAVVALLAERLRIDPSSVALANGQGSPAKIVVVNGMIDGAIRGAFPHENLGKTGGVGTLE